MGFKLDRPAPTAEFSPCPQDFHAVHRAGRHILLRTGRADVRMTAREAIRLAGELLGASVKADDYDKGNS